MGNSLEKTNIQWHSGFCGAAELELGSDRDMLEFCREYNLSKAPLKMDMLIIKKTADAEIKNEIGRMFRTYNVMEYKSPDDSLSVSDYYKTMAYACLYKGLEESVDQIPAGEITVSLVRSRYPRKLFAALRKEGLEIQQPYQGIYYIKGKTLFDTQVIVTSRLNRRNHRSLRLLSANVQREEVEEFIKAAEELENPGDRNNVEAVLQVSIGANQELYGEIRRDSFMYNALRELLNDEIEKEKRSAVQTAVQKAEQETLLEAIKNLMGNLELSADEVMSAMSLPEEKWAEYRAKL